MNDNVDSFVLNRSAVNDHRRKAVCCMCGTLKRPFCWANRGLEEQPFCSWKCRKLYLYGPDVENSVNHVTSGGAQSQQGEKGT